MMALLTQKQKLVSRNISPYWQLGIDSVQCVMEIGETLGFFQSVLLLHFFFRGHSAIDCSVHDRLQRCRETRKAIDTPLYWHTPPCRDAV